MEQFKQVFPLGRKGGAVLRAFHSHKCGLCSCPGINGRCELSLLLVLSLASRGFPLGTPVFPSKTNSKSSSIRNGRPRTTLWMCYLQIVFIYFFFKIYVGNLNFFPYHSPSLRFNYIICYISIYYNVRRFKQPLQSFPKKIPMVQLSNLIIWIGFNQLPQLLGHLYAGA